MNRDYAGWITRTWRYWLAGWGLAVLLLFLVAPDWESIVTQGVFKFLPDDASSKIADRVLDESFDDAEAESTLLLVVESRESTLTERDFAFVRGALREALDAAAAEIDDDSEIIVDTTDHSDPVTGDLFVSDDGRATLLAAQLKDEYLHERTWAYVNAVDVEIARLDADGEIPEGLRIGLTGGATIGRDLVQYRSDSAEWVGSWTVWFVVALLLCVYRAPIVALIPLGTLLIAVQASRYVLAILAQAGVIGLFDGIEVYITVILYGAGVDYSLFLVSRFREELTRTEDERQATTVALDRTGSSIIASALTEIVGIGLLGFATFGQLQQAGIAIAIGLCVMLAAALTLTPAVLLLIGRRAFWPFVPRVDPAQEQKLETPVIRWWDWIGRFVIRRPAIVLTVTTAALLPFAILGIVTFGDTSYGILEEFPGDAPSVLGTEMLQDHFPAGVIGPVVVVLDNPDVDYADDSGRERIDDLTTQLLDRADELQLDDVLSLTRPLGDESDVLESRSSALVNLLIGEVAEFEAARHYVSTTAERGNHVTRLYLARTFDPFSRAAIERLDALEEEIVALAGEDTTVHLAGPTASLRSLRRTAEFDRLVLQPVIGIAITILLVVMLRHVVTSLYLVGTILFTYFVALGVTWGVFAVTTPGDFPGLDWSVPLLLYTVLIAVGADYNVFLVNRAREERDRHGDEEGIALAVRRTGAVVTGCGVVMAGTFATLLIGGELASLKQLGFALAFAILVDTFIVRPFLVPAFLAIKSTGFDFNRAVEEFTELGAQVYGTAPAGEGEPEAVDSHAEPTPPDAEETERTTTA